jgi:hypothetical protein
LACANETFIIEQTSVHPFSPICAPPLPNCRYIGPVAPHCISPPPLFFWNLSAFCRLRELP